MDDGFIIYGRMLQIYGHGFILYRWMLQIYEWMIQIYGPSLHNLRNVYNRILFEI